MGREERRRSRQEVVDQVECFLEFLEVFDEGCYCFVQVCCGAGVGGRGLRDDCVDGERCVDVVVLWEGEAGKVFGVEGSLFLIHFGQSVHCCADQSGVFLHPPHMALVATHIYRRSDDLQIVCSTSIIARDNAEVPGTITQHRRLRSVRSSLLLSAKDVIARQTHQSSSTQETTIRKPRIGHSLQTQ